MPKTGTSALQKFLATNRNILERNNFLFPDFGYVYPDVGKGRNGYFLSRTTDQAFRETYKKEWEDSFWQLDRLAKGGKRIILSDESIWSVQRRPDLWEAIRDIFISVGLDVHLIVYLRRQDEILESYWNQKVKSHNRLSLTFDEFLVHEFHRMPLRYKKLLFIIEQKLMPKQLTVRAYERGQLLGGNIIDDFCNVVGFVPDESCQYPEKVVNQSFDLDTLDVKRLINQNASYQEINDFYYKAITDSCYENDQSNTGKSPFSYEDRVAFMQRFQAGNEYVAQTYLNRKDGRLFYEPLKETEKWEADALPQYRAAVRVLSGADILLYKRLRKLEEKVAALEQDNAINKIRRKLKPKHK